MAREFSALYDHGNASLKGNVKMNTKTRILDIAEARIRETGYNAISFREIATELGIKSASLHYHFPHKADLGVALVERYGSNFREALFEEGEDLPAQVMLNRYINLYSDALGSNCRACLCVMLGTEASGLPDSVSAAVRAFVDEHLNWLGEWFSVLGEDKATLKAQTTLASLQGGMMLSALRKDRSIFEGIASSAARRN